MTDPDLSLDQQISVFLATCRTASLATADREGAPHAANVQYVQDAKLNLYWVSSENSAHSRNLAARPQTAVTIYAHDDRAAHIHGLQMHGTAAALSDPADCNAAWELYTAKFAFVAANPQLRAAVEAQTFYCFTPAWLRWIDNRRGFGFKVEKRLDETPDKRG